LVVQKIVGIPRFGIQNIRKKLKIKALAQQFRARGFRFSLGIEFRQNPVILAQFVVHIAHKIGTVLVHFIVVGIPATVATELFVLATHNFFATFQTGFVHNNYFFAESFQY
jgi:hypothetical protein